MVTVWASVVVVSSLSDDALIMRITHFLRSIVQCRAPRTHGARASLACAAVVAAPLIAPLSGCASAPEAAGADAQASSRAQTVSSAPSTYDPLGGDYPHIMWMANLMEVDRPIAIDANGLVVTVNEASAAPPFARVLTQEQERGFFDSVQRVSGYELLSAPLVMSRPGAQTEISVGARDKPGASTQQMATRLKGRIAGEHVVADVACLRNERGALAAWQSIEGVSVAAGGGVVLAAPVGDAAPDGRAQRWAVAFVRPTILRSLDDYPFQRSSMPSTTR